MAEERMIIDCQDYLIFLFVGLLLELYDFLNLINEFNKINIVDYLFNKLIIDIFIKIVKNYSDINYRILYFNAYVFISTIDQS